MSDPPRHGWPSPDPQSYGGVQYHICPAHRGTDDLRLTLGPLAASNARLLARPGRPLLPKPSSSPGYGSYLPNRRWVMASAAPTRKLPIGRCPSAAPDRKLGSIHS
ncbi:hypothetical protein DPMN_098069 [Dreissena polymorpha]|uniref:Uncharacterized protein n=1 Tax=Dreissena polymorpha TaxID=45954 RepID=A0A9D4LCB3_DREPO|nr:hypothetical protein DPMN_098069 [Dreissena polymorpha]